MPHSAQFRNSNYLNILRFTQPPGLFGIFQGEGWAILLLPPSHINTYHSHKMLKLWGIMVTNPAARSAQRNSQCKYAPNSPAVLLNRFGHSHPHTYLKIQENCLWRVMSTVEFGCYKQILEENNSDRKRVGHSILRMNLQIRQASTDQQSNESKATAISFFRGNRFWHSQTKIYSSLSTMEQPSV